MTTMHRQSHLLLPRFGWKQNIGIVSDTQTSTNVAIKIEEHTCRDHTRKVVQYCNEPSNNDIDSTVAKDRVFIKTHQVKE